MKYITETFEQAARRVPELATLSDKVISDSLAQAMELADTIPGYSLMQYVATVGQQPPLFVFRAAPLPEASPATKGQCNDERACGACFSGQSACETTAPAPQVTPAVVEAVIGSEHYFTADQGERQEIEDYLRDHPGEYPPFIPDPLHMITICTLVTKNGHSVVGVAYCADPARFNAQTGRDAARADAIRQLWPMVIYAERNRLAAPPSIQLTPAEVQSGLDRVRWAEGLIKQLPENHDGRNSWLLNYGTDKAERQAEWARRNPQSSLAKNIAAAPDLRPAASDDDF